MKKFLLQLTGALLVCLALGLTSCKKDNEVTPAEEVYSVNDLTGVWKITNTSVKEVYLDHRGNNLSIIEFNSNSVINGNKLEYNYKFSGTIINARRIEIVMAGPTTATTNRVLTR